MESTLFCSLRSGATGTFNTIQFLSNPVRGKLPVNFPLCHSVLRSVQMSLKVVSSCINAGLVSSEQIHDGMGELGDRDGADFSVYSPFQGIDVSKSGATKASFDAVEDKEVARRKVWTVSRMGQKFNVILHDESLNDVSTVSWCSVMLQNPVSALPQGPPAPSHVLFQQLEMTQVLMVVNSLASGYELTTDHTPHIKEKHQHCFDHTLVTTHFGRVWCILSHPLHAATPLGGVIDQKP